MIPPVVKIIDNTTRGYVKDKLIKVARRPSVTEAYFLDEGYYEIITSNGKSYAEGPVWILWDTSGFPCPITPDEFEKLYEPEKDVQ